MTDRINVPANEHGVVRIFAIDLPRDDLAAFAPPELEGVEVMAQSPLRAALGVDRLDMEYVDIIHPEDLGEMGLSGYLNDGLGLSAQEIAGARTHLDGITGPVALVLSKAHAGEAAILTPRAPLRWVATLNEPQDVHDMAPLRSDGAAGVVTGGKPPKSDAAIGGRIATIALLVLALLVILMIWIA